MSLQTFFQQLTSREQARTKTAGEPLHATKSATSATAKKPMTETVGGWPSREMVAQ